MYTHIYLYILFTMCQLLWQPRICNTRCGECLKVLYYLFNPQQKYCLYFAQPEHFMIIWKVNIAVYKEQRFYLSKD